MTSRNMLLVVLALLSFLVKGRGQSLDLGLEQTTEIQSNLQHVKALGLLETSLNWRVCSGLAVEAHTLTVMPTNADPLICDLQGFSNIDAEAIPLKLSVLSVAWETEHTTLKAGYRNLDEHYFATPGLALFTHSSHGIPPTLSANLPVPTYTESALGGDFCWQSGKWQGHTSYYHPGLTLLQLSYGPAHLGAAHHVALKSCAVWTYSELPLGERLTLIPQYSYAFGPSSLCRQYAALAITTPLGKAAELGLAETVAWYTENKEFATELTASIELGENVTLQPAIHLIHTTPSDTHFAALLRLTISS